MAFAFVRRTANRTGFSTPDKNHLHHRLLRLGHGHRRSVLILWAWTVLLSGFILFPLYNSSVNAFIPFGALALGVVLYTLFHPSLRRQSGLGPEGEPPIDEPPEVGPGAGEGVVGLTGEAPGLDGAAPPAERTTPQAGVPAPSLRSGRV
jgi:UDP-GlcNAc:undecaprenyl-phosphate GlcNAc-1-phosphate transferase